MKRQNDFAGEMGRKYQEAMKVICPQDDEMKKLIAREATKNFQALSKKGTGATLLDLGCGNGNLIDRMFYADIYNSWVETFVGVDSAEAMIREAKDKLWVPVQQEQVILEQADITEYLTGLIPLEKLRANTTLSTFVLHNFTQQERQRVFPLIYQTLTPEGVFYLGDKIAITNPAEHAQDYAAQIKLIQSLAEHGMPELVQPWLDHYKMDNSPERRMIEGELVNQLRAV